MAQFTAYREPGLEVDGLFLCAPVSGPGASTCGARPSGQLLVAGLGVAVAMAVKSTDTSPVTLAMKVPQIGAVR